MIYFVIGSSIREIELEKLKENFENVLKFDANIKEEYEKFIDNIYLNSLFSTNELLILKNSHKLKKIEELIDELKEYNNENKSIIIDYEYKYKNSPLIKKFKDIDAKIISVEDEKAYVLNYIMTKLEISQSEAKKLADIIGHDYNHITNEIYKFKSLLEGDKYSFEKIKDIIVSSNDKILNDKIEKLHNLNLDSNEIEENQVLSFIYLIYKEFDIIHKLKKLNLSKNHDEFKKEYEQFQTLFNSNYYPIFLKNKMKDIYTEKQAFRILRLCNYFESKIKEGLYTNSIALYLLIKEIYNVRAK